MMVKCKRQLLLLTKQLELLLIQIMDKKDKDVHIRKEQRIVKLLQVKPRQKLLLKL